MTTESTRARLDGPYVDKIANEVAVALWTGTPVEVNFQPGDGTRYQLVFLPLQNLKSASPRIAPMGDGEPVSWGDRCSFGVHPRVPGKALVVYVDKGAVAFDFTSGGYVGAYLARLFDVTFGSGETLEILFEKIVETFVWLSGGGDRPVAA